MYLFASFKISCNPCFWVYLSHCSNAIHCGDFYFPSRILAKWQQAHDLVATWAPFKFVTETCFLCFRIIGVFRVLHVNCGSWFFFGRLNIVRINVCIYLKIFWRKWNTWTVSHILWYFFDRFMIINVNVYRSITS